MSPTGAPMDAIEEEFLQAVDVLQHHLTILRLRRKGKPSPAAAATSMTESTLPDVVTPKS